MKKRKIVVSRSLQFQEAIATVAIAILSINLTIIFSTLIGNGFEVGKLSITFLQALGIALTEFLLLCLLFFVALRRTARIAGPVKAIAREVAKLGQGDLSAQINLRKGDAFASEANVINLAANSLRERVAHMNQICLSMKSLDHSSSIDHLIEELQKDLSSMLPHSNKSP